MNLLSLESSFAHEYDPHYDYGDDLAYECDRRDRKALEGLDPISSVIEVCDNCELSYCLAASDNPEYAILVSWYHDYIYDEQYTREWIRLEDYREANGALKWSEIERRVERHA